MPYKKSKSDADGFTKGEIKAALKRYKDREGITEKAKEQRLIEITGDAMHEDYEDEVEKMPYKLRGRRI